MPENDENLENSNDISNLSFFMIPDTQELPPGNYFVRVCNITERWVSDSPKHTLLSLGCGRYVMERDENIKDDAGWSLFMFRYYDLKVEKNGDRVAAFEIKNVDRTRKNVQSLARK